MTEFQKQFEEVQDFLKFDDYTLTIKRIIDFTLDTQSLAFYQKTNALLDWLDTNENNPEKKHRQFYQKCM